MALFRHWRGFCVITCMLNRIARLFVIKNKFEAFLVIYGLGVGAVERGMHYRVQYPGTQGWILFAACTLAVFMAGAKIIDAVEHGKPD